MKILEAIGKGFSIAGKNIGLLTLLFVFNSFWNLAPLPFLGKAQNVANLKPTPPVIILTFIFILINIFIQGGAFGVLKEAIASDGKAGLSNVGKYGKKFYLRLLGMGLVILLGIALAVLLIGLIASIALVVKNIIVNIIAISVAIILGAIVLYYLFLFFLSPYVLVVDDVGVFKAMGNSLRFVKSRFLKMIGLSTLLLLIGLGIGFIMGVITGFLSLVVKGLAFQIVTGVVTGAANSYITVVMSSALMVYYYTVSGGGQGRETEGISASA